MTIIFHNIYKELNYNNLMFNQPNVSIGDNLLAPFIRLKEYAETLNIKVYTSSAISIKSADIIVFVDMPEKNDNIFIEAIKLNKSLYLLAMESPVIRPSSFNIKNHIPFEKVFTWNDNLIKKDPIKYIKINYSYDIPKPFNIDIDKKERLCCMISGNKILNYKNELYSKRLEAIKWFETYHSNDFDLYGVGWDQYESHNRYIRFFLNKFKSIKSIVPLNHPSYKGKVERKKPILEKYKFSICYENVKDISGYITEKIFDCFFAGNIPIYLGADNISKYIPPNCFIDKRDYDNYEELYQYITTISDKEYTNYLNNIEKFIHSDLIYSFTSEFFSKQIIDNLRKL